MSFNRGSELGDWSLSSRLGSGGNSEVWLAEHPEHGEAALKILARKGYDRWQRFRDEVAVMERVRDNPGVLPLIASHLPVVESQEKAWLATPVAEPLVDALGDAAALSQVVRCLLDLATTLAVLDSQGIHHRDLKPANLFRYEGRWVIGDFGLAEYPEKEAVTVATRRLGPLYFIAPEMLRQPDEAAGGPADVYSLAKTLWVLAAGQRYPPEGQIRVDESSHDLSRWVEGAGALALTLKLQRPTASDPSQRPTMAEFADELRSWFTAGAAQDDRVARQLRTQYMEQLERALSSSLDPEVFMGLESEIRAILTRSRKRYDERLQQLRQEARREQDREHREYIERTGVKGVLSLHDSPWIGCFRDGDDLAEAVLHCRPEERKTELIRARQILWGRPLWWSHTVALIGALRLRGCEGCEPLATQLASGEVRNHLLAFPDHPSQAASWRLQRSLIPLTVRSAPLSRFDQVSQSLEQRLSAVDRLRYATDPGRLMMITVGELLRSRLRQLDWRPAALTEVALNVEAALAGQPIPDVEWTGPLGDPWLKTWADYSPMLMCGLDVLNAHEQGDELLGSDELRRAITDAAQSKFVLLRRPAEPLALRLGLI